jgi:hypothetical protein
MKLNYYLETDSLYIDLMEKPSVESREVSVIGGHLSLFSFEIRLQIQKSL